MAWSINHQAITRASVDPVYALPHGTTPGILYSLLVVKTYVG